MPLNIRDLKNTTLEINPKDVICGFIMCHEVLEMYLFQLERIEINTLFEQKLGRLWPEVLITQPAIPTHHFLENKIEVKKLFDALKEKGDFNLNHNTIAFVKVKYQLNKAASALLSQGYPQDTPDELFLGFCYKSSQPEVILFNNDNIIPESNQEQKLEQANKINQSIKEDPLPKAEKKKWWKFWD